HQFFRGLAVFVRSLKVGAIIGLNRSLIICACLRKEGRGRVIVYLPKKIICLSRPKVHMCEILRDFGGGRWQSMRFLQMFQMIRRMNKRFCASERAIGDVGLAGSLDLLSLGCIHPGLREKDLALWI